MAHDPCGADPNEWSTVSPASVVDFFRSLNKRVIYFSGYGELGYQDDQCVRRVAQKILRGREASSLIVLCGTLLRLNGQDGISEVYAIAKTLGFQTAGIHPSIAMKFGSTHRVSPYCDQVFFISDDSWGGFLPGTETPSPTLEVHLAVSDEMIAIGGGRYAADEIQAFAGTGRTPHYFPAEMNLAAMQAWCATAKVALLDPMGAAHLAWRTISQSAGREVDLTARPVKANGSDL